MGCSNGRTKEKEKKLKTKFSFPQCINSFLSNPPVQCMIPVDSLRVLLGIQNQIKLLDISSIAPTSLFEEHKESINCLLSIHHNIFASASEDKTIKIWDMNIPQSKCTLIGHTSSITTMTKINNETIASGGNDNKIIIWDINLKVFSWK